MPRVTAALMLSFVLALATSVRADVAPDPDYVERCTLGQQQESGDECVECRASFEEPERCKQQYASGGYAPRCQTRGASVWTEIWCRVKPESSNDDSEFAQPPPDDRPVELATDDHGSLGPSEKRGSCGACGVGAPTDPMGPIGAVLTLAILLGLRRRGDG